MMSETTPTEPTTTTAAPAGRTVELAPSEIELLVTALRLLRSTLGRDEAEELAEVTTLLARLEG